jgi:hypothetical protein
VTRRYALVPAAGGGIRAGLGAPKQYYTIGGQTVLAHTLDRLYDALALDRVFVAIAPDDDRYVAAIGSRPGVEPLPCGGLTRATTVANALRIPLRAALSAGSRHDAARPCVPAVRCGWSRPSRTTQSAACRRAGRRHAQARRRRCRAAHRAHRGPRRVVAGADAADVPLRPPTRLMPSTMPKARRRCAGRRLPRRAESAPCRLIPAAGPISRSPYPSFALAEAILAAQRQ